MESQVFLLHLQVVAHAAYPRTCCPGKLSRLAHELQAAPDFPGKPLLEKGLTHALQSTTSAVLAQRLWYLSSLRHIAYTAFPPLPDSRAKLSAIRPHLADVPDLADRALLTELLDFVLAAEGTSGPRTAR